jgi:hypothetical protein
MNGERSDHSLGTETRGYLIISAPGDVVVFTECNDKSKYVFQKGTSYGMHFEPQPNYFKKDETNGITAASVGTSTPELKIPIQNFLACE